LKYNVYDEHHKKHLTNWKFPVDAKFARILQLVCTDVIWSKYS